MASLEAKKEAHQGTGIVIAIRGDTVSIHEGGKGEVADVHQSVNGNGVRNYILKEKNTEVDENPLNSKEIFLDVADSESMF